MSTPAEYLEPKEINPNYVDHRGPYRVNLQHLARILPEFEKPESSLVEKLREMRIPIAGVDKYYGIMDPNNIYILVGIARAMESKAVFEIGTGKGVLTRLLADNTPEDCVIQTLDIKPSDMRLGRSKYRINQWNQNYVKHDDEDVGMYFKGSPAENKIRQHFGDSATFDFSPFKGLMDLVIVDANHDYEPELEDLVNGFKLAKSRGLICLDDFAKPTTAVGATYAVMHLARFGYAFYHIADLGPSEPDEKTTLVIHPKVPEAKRDISHYVIPTLNNDIIKEL